MKRFLIAITAALVFFAGSVFAESPEKVPFTIDADFPGGNIIVESITPDAEKGVAVRLRQDQRDTPNPWFYWAFRVRGAEGQTANFSFSTEKGPLVGARGPAISLDEGLTWRWLGDKGFSSERWTYTFGPDEKSVTFAFGMIYTEATLRRFLDAGKDRFKLEEKVLCRSRKGRDVELFRFGNPENEHRLGMVMTCRHHACEMMAAYVIEGVVEEVFSGDDEGNWLRENVDFFWVPFVDKDGVEDGDQGKYRAPHDHNFDYVEKIYPEVRAIMEQVPAWSRGKRIAFCDFHCPWIRSGINEILYFPGVESPYMAEQQRRFAALLEKRQQGGTIPYQASSTLTYGEGWNKGTGDKRLMITADWGTTLPNAIYSSTFEICYANASGAAVTVDSARELGRNFARALCDFLKEEVARPTTNCP